MNPATDREGYPRSASNYLVRTSMRLEGGQVWLGLFLWDREHHTLVNQTTVTGKPEDLNDRTLREMFGASPEEKALRAAASKAARWIREYMFPPVQVIAISANIRRDPSLQSVIIAAVPQGTILRKVGEQEGWFEVVLESDESGWINEELVK
jgi:hypothetical protein